MAKIKITLVRSMNSATDRQVANLASLGLRKMHQTVIVESNPISLGMVEKIKHLVKIEETK